MTNELPRWRAIRDTVGPYNNVFWAGAEIASEDCPGSPKDWHRVGTTPPAPNRTAERPMVMPQAGITILPDTPHGSIVGRRVPVHEDPPVPWYEFASDTSPDFIDGELRHRGTRWPSLSWPNAGMRPLNAPAKEVASYYEKHRGHAGLPRTAWDDTNARVNQMAPADIGRRLMQRRNSAADVPARCQVNCVTCRRPPR